MENIDMENMDNEQNQQVPAEAESIPQSAPAAQPQPMPAAQPQMEPQAQPQQQGFYSGAGVGQREMPFAGTPHTADEGYQAPYQQPYQTQYQQAGGVVFCQHCATQFDASQAYCPQCGTRR